MRIAQPRMRRRGLRDGVGFIWFTLLAMPILMTSLMLSVDFARLVILNHEMRNVADSAAVAGAWETRPGTIVIDESAAQRAVEETVCNSMRHLLGGVSDAPGYGASPYCDFPITVSTTYDNENTNEAYPAEGYTQVEVTVHYRVEGLVFPAYFGLGRTIDDAQVTRRASVCVPNDQQGPTQGDCLRPTF